MLRHGKTRGWSALRMLLAFALAFSTVLGGQAAFAAGDSGSTSSSSSSSSASSSSSSSGSSSSSSSSSTSSGKTNDGADYEIDVPETGGASSFVAAGTIALLVLAGLAYLAYQYRAEIQAFWRKHFKKSEKSPEN